jgi:hypothetical protein
LANGTGDDLLAVRLHPKREPLLRSGFVEFFYRAHVADRFLRELPPFQSHALISLEGTAEQPVRLHTVVSISDARDL